MLHLLYSIILLNIQEPEAGPIKVPVPDDLAGRVRKILERSNEITRAWDDLHLDESDAPIRDEDYEIKPVSTTSHVDDVTIVGREEDKENIIEMLLSDDEAAERHMSVLPIVGMGGLGKTTLAQLVYNDQMVCKYFELKGWVDVSEDNFDVKAIARNIIMSFTGKPCEVEEMDDLQNMIMAQVEGTKFFLVLDNVWKGEKNFWDALLSPMVSAQLGMILVTTRNENFPTMMQAMSTYHLRCLSCEESWQLFKQMAFESEDQHMDQQFEEIGRKIVRKCGGLPLAVKAIGVALRGETNEETWKDVLESDQWELPTREDIVLPALKLSYDRMPVHLKRCFVFLSLLPKGYLFWKEYMISLWTCLGLLKQYSSRHHENIGGLYFDDLVQRTMIQRAESCEKVQCFVTHDLIHDLANFVSGEDFLRIDTRYLHETAANFRYLSVVVSSSEHTNVVLHSLTVPRGVRILKIVNALDNRRCSSKLFSSSINIKIPIEIWQNFQQLRALDFSHTALTAVPDSVGELRLLRYLSLFQTRITSIPESVCSLYNLKVLDARTDSLREIPRGIKNLVNLRHLNLDLWSPLCMPCGIGVLTKLQTLPRFSVGSGSWHCNVAELHHLVSINGELCITGLRRVSNVDDAQTANLVSKQHLQILRLDWSDGVCANTCSHPGSQNDVASTPELEEAVFESLRPHKNITELEVVSYGGYRYPSWLGAASFLQLAKIILCQHSCMFLPPLGELTQLRTLSVICMTGVERVRQEFRGNIATKAFPALEELEFEEILKWVEWSDVVDDDFPSLRQLKIKDSHELRYLPQKLSSSLTKMVIKDCSKLSSLPAVPNLTTLVLKSKINEDLLNALHFPLLRSLKVLLSQSIECILLNNQNHPLLEVLAISVCPRLQSVMGLSSLGSLKFLKINACPYLQLPFDQPLPPQLQRLNITKCPKLEDWLEFQTSEHQDQV